MSRARVRDSDILLRSAITAFFIEAFALIAIGTHEHWMVHPHKVGLDDTKFIEAEFFKLPKESHLTEEKPRAAPAPRREATISKVPSHSKQPPPSAAQPKEEENQTQSGPKLAPTHGPIAVYAPSPVIPAYLQNQELKTSVVIDFFINSQGGVTPRLVGSSGNEELDAIAIEAVKKWQFRPAENDHHAIDSKVRLRIVFEVK